jgi:hypothetical protein
MMKGKIDMGKSGEKIKKMGRAYFEIWGDEQAQNVLLKGLLTGLAVLFVIETLALMMVSLRKPVIIAIGQDQTEVLKITPPGDELLTQELSRSVRNYIQYHYTWDSGSIEKAHEMASHYVSDRFRQAFLSANADQIKIAKEKRLQETVYVSSIKTDSKTLSARVFLDRILIIDGLRATNPWVLDVHFEYGPRTDINPEGIYITSEQPVEKS